MKRRFFVKNLLAILIPIIVPILILGVFSTFLVENTVKHEIGNNSAMTLTQVKNVTELMFNELDTLSINFYLNASFVTRLKTLLAANTVDYDNANIQRWFSSIINASVNAKPYIHSVYLFYENPKDNMLVSNQGLTNIQQYPDTHWYQRYQQPCNPQTFFEARSVRTYAFEEEGTPVITLYKHLYSPGAIVSDGMIVMNIRQSSVQELLSAPGDTYPLSVFLIQSDSTVLSEGKANHLSDSQLDFNRLQGLSDGVSYLSMGGGRFVVMQMSSDRYDIKYLSINTYEDFFRLPMILSRTTILLLVVSFVLGALIAWITTLKNQRQLRDTLNIFDLVERGLPLPTPPQKDTGAFDYIQQKIIRTFIESSYLRLQLEARKYQAKSLELTALQSQINPHFLFNTLKTIFWKTVALTGDHNDASRMIEQLSSILQYSLSPSHTLVSLKEEIENTKNYVRIQKVRYNNRFEVIWDYDTEVLACSCIRLLFQPFIENSIYHGCYPEEGKKCYIKIKIKRREDGLRVSIMDTGQGIPPKRLERIRRKMDGELTDEEAYAHIGIANTNKRLQLLYGDSAKIHMASQLGVGTWIRFTLPAHVSTGAETHSHPPRLPEGPEDG